ncbi:MAG TPA: TIGR01777 family oxidoreductase [Flavobacteriaceae bacterium]|nr:TIGR01777 family oxidoreductase [Flavobacteriaceae bacterium]HEX5742398.1 TIGR01777 family oxidoreductase [Flavobacteriaceae bacterium]
MNSNEIVLITGGTGMIAQRVSRLLENSGYEVRFLSRNKKSEKHFLWDINTGFIDTNVFNHLDHIVHLAGADISEKRWSKQRKKEILDSRIKSTQLLFNAIKKHTNQLKTFVATSAVGYYGTSTKDVLFTEESPNGHDFLAHVCKLWEDEADLFSTFNNTRVVKLRFGVVLDSNGGAFAKMKKPITMGFGAVLGNGQQYIPWIHIEDLCNLLLFTIENDELSGVFNAVAPQQITNEQLTYLIAEKLHKTIWLPKAPSFVLKFIFGELSSIILKGNRVSCQKLILSKFAFKYPAIDQALDHLLEK